MKRIKAGVIVIVALFIAASVSAGVKDGQCPPGSNPSDTNASGFTNSIGMEFVPTPAGTGKLGTGAGRCRMGFGMWNSRMASTFRRRRLLRGNTKY